MLYYSILFYATTTLSSFLDLDEYHYIGTCSAPSLSIETETVAEGPSFCLRMFPSQDPLCFVGGKEGLILAHVPLDLCVRVILLSKLLTRCVLRSRRCMHIEYLQSQMSPHPNQPTGTNKRTSKPFIFSLVTASKHALAVASGLTHPHNCFTPAFSQSSSCSFCTSFSGATS